VDKSGIENWQRPENLRTHDGRGTLDFMTFCSMPPEEIGRIQTAYTNGTLGKSHTEQTESIAQKRLTPPLIFGIMLLLLVPCVLFFSNSLPVHLAFKMIPAILLAFISSLYGQKNKKVITFATFVGTKGASYCAYQSSHKIKQHKTFVLFADIASFKESKTSKEFLFSFLDTSGKTIFEIRGSSAIDSRAGQEARVFANALLGAWENSRMLKNQAA
jgi:hypothetical protein